MKKFLFLAVAIITMIVSVLISQLYYKLALDMIPPAALSNLSRGMGPVGFAWWGFLIGLGLVALEALLFWLLPVAMRGQKSPGPKTP